MEARSVNRKFFLLLAINLVFLANAAFAGKDSCDAKSSKKAFAKCAACHSINEGGATLLGPNLHGIINRYSGEIEGFPYSPAMMAYQKKWTEKELDKFLQDPMKVVPGTMMAFGGLRKERDRQAVLCYLRNNS